MFPDVRIGTGGSGMIWSNIFIALHIINDHSSDIGRILVPAPEA